MRAGVRPATGHNVEPVNTALKRTLADTVSMPFTRRLRPVTPLVVRLVVGSVMIAHAGHFTPGELGVILDQRLGLPFSTLIAWAITLMLYIGGALFIIGLLSRWVAVPFIVHMSSAVALIDVHEGLAPQSGGGMQIALLLLTGSLVILASGPGPFSLDNIIGWDNGWSDVRATGANQKRIEPSS